MTKLPLLVLVVLLALGSAGAAGGKVYLPGASRSAARADAHSASMTLAASLPKGGTVNSDIAFWGNLAYHGSYDGFRVIDISKPTAPSVLADVHCGAGQGDVTVWKNILVRSVDYPVTQRSCKGQRADDPTVAGQFEGLQIFDVTKPRRPRLLKLVDTDCGSHTNTLVPDTAHGRVLVYVLSYALLPGPHCGGNREANPLHAKISIVSVPLANPARAAIVGTPPVEAEAFDGGQFGTTIGCHDMGVFMPLHLAAVACLSEAQLWDISDPLHPRTIAHIQEPVPGFEIWHSATFTWDGKYIVFGDESGSSSCHGDGTEPDGRVWFYKVSDLLAGNTTTPLSSFLIGRNQHASYCSAHMFNVVPVKNRYVLVSSWYTGGVDVIEFTDPAHPRELGWYDLESPREGEFWAAYWYNGFVYGSDMPNGFDSFRFKSTRVAGAKRLGHLNPQTQEMYVR